MPVQQCRRACMHAALHDQTSKVVPGSASKGRSSRAEGCTHVHAHVQAGPGRWEMRRVRRLWRGRPADTHACTRMQANNRSAAPACFTYHVQTVTYRETKQAKRGCVAGRGASERAA